MAIDAAKAPAGECGVENQVGRVGVTFLHPLQSNFHAKSKLLSVGSFR